MHSALALLVANAILAMGSPMPAPTPKAQLEQRDYVHVVKEIEVTTKYVYPNGAPAYGYKPNERVGKPAVFYHQEEEAAAPNPAPQPAPKPEPKYEPVVEEEEQEEEPVNTGGNYADPGEDFVKNSLYHHNVHRSNHSASDVTWSAKLANAAQQLANTCNYGHDTKIGGGGYGQNIAMKAATYDLGTETEFVRTSISDYWYNSELGLYGNSYGREPSMSNFHGWGHFSQIVWKGTKEVGCAVAYCKSGLASYPGYFSVCNYSPPGNFRGRYAENVAAPQGKPMVTA